MDKPEKHLFHFVMDRGMKNELKRLEMYKKAGSLSGIIVNIFSFLIPLIKKEHKWGEQRASRYLPVCDDSEEIREHIYVYFPEEMYRQLKLIHQDLNVYSIAQLLRGFLRFFLDWVTGYGKKAIKELKKLFKRWKKEDGLNQLTPRKIVQQLLLIIQHISGKNKLINIYDSKFSPFWIFLL